MTTADLSFDTEDAATIFAGKVPPLDKLAPWLEEQRRVDMAYIKLCSTIDRGFTCALADVMAEEYPDLWEDEDAAGLAIQRAGWGHRLNMPEDKIAGTLPPVHFSFIDEDGCRAHRFWFAGLGILTDWRLEPVGPLPAGTIPNTVGPVGSITLG